jgi:hypothetical protein
VLPPPAILVTPLYEVDATVIEPDVGELNTTVPMLLANPFNSKLMPVPAGCEHVTANCPPALKKYLAASPEANVIVWTKVKAELQVLAYVAVLELVLPCVAAFSRLV